MTFSENTENGSAGILFKLLLWLFSLSGLLIRLIRGFQQHM